MKYYRFNQIAMAVLGALLLIFGTRTIMQIAFEEHKPEKPGFEVAGDKHGEKPGAEAPAAASNLAALLAKGDAAKGEQAAAVCKVCHAFEAGAPSPIGPNLHNVVGRKIASVEGFNYSPALKAKSGEDWTYENLDHFIHKPAEYAPGTLMAFPGIPDQQQLADILLFLRSKTDNPPPLPEPAAASAEAPAPAAEGEAKPAEDQNAVVAALVAKADPAKGEADAALCKVCHAFEKGAPSPVGPNLYGVIGRPIASVEGFNYSPALKAKAAEGNWDYAHIDAFIHKPMEYAPGTMMAFPGIPEAEKRAEVIAWLRTKADSPAPLPEAAAAAPEAAPAAEEKPAETAPAPATEEKPAETPPAPAAEEKPAESAPAPAAEEKPAETPPPAAEEKPAESAPPPAAEEKPAEAAPAESSPPAAEETAPAPAAEEKPAEAARAPAEEQKPAEAPASAEEPSASAPAAPAPMEEPSAPAPAAPASGANTSPPATDSQPKPVYPSGPPQ